MDARARELETSAALRREIAGQAGALEATLHDSALAWEMDALAADVRASGELLIAGMGASHHAGQIAATVLRAAGLRVWALAASEQLHYGAALPVRPLLLVSRSGASIEIARLLQHGGAGLYGLTLDPESPLGRAGAGIVPGGPERGLPATRSFTSTLAALLVLAGKLGVAVDARELAPSLEPALAQLPRLLQAAARLREVDAIAVTGRGPLAGLAGYAALLLSELTRAPCLALDAGQFRHGPFEAAGSRLGVVALAAAGGTGELVRTLVGELAGAGSPAVLIDAADVATGAAAAAAPAGEAALSGRSSPAVDGVAPPARPAPAGDVLRVGLPRVDETAAALPLAVVVQRLAVALAEARGIPPGVPLRSSKVPPVE